MSIKVDIFGHTDVIRLLKELNNRGVRQVASTALRTGAKFERDRAKEIMPQAGGGDSGEARGLMRKWTRVRAQARKRGISRTKVGLNVIHGTRDKLQIPELTKRGKKRGYYPASLEFGWRFGKRGGPRGRRRYLGKTLDQHKYTINDIIANESRAELYRQIAKNRPRIRRYSRGGRALGTLPT